MENSHRGYERAVALEIRIQVSLEFPRWTPVNVKLLLFPGRAGGFAAIG
jgi:hypothetical protein